MGKAPNVVFIFADEWRAQATGYNGDPNCETPVLDKLASESIDITHAVSGSSVCCPYRASLMTGQYPLTNGVYLNDVELDPHCRSIARAFSDGGYQTAYIGKWHLYGSPDGHYGRRAAIVPRECQLGFDYWKGFECNHDYDDSHYFFNDDPTPRPWEGYDAQAQSVDAAQYISDNADDVDPFMMMVSWGPPHFPLHTAPATYRDRYRDRPIELRPNVPADHQDKAIDDLRGYYAHIAALDDCLKTILDSLSEAGIAQDTILIFTSDHGDMFESQGLQWKHYPWDESIRVPFLLRWPALHGREGSQLALPLDAPDIMPTLLSLCGLASVASTEGRDWAPIIEGETSPDGEEAALLSVPVSFFNLRRVGMAAHRGLRTMRHTYVRDIDGPWLLFDNVADPYQMSNLIDNQSASDLLDQLDGQLQRRLDALGDQFLSGETYLARDGYEHYAEVAWPIGEKWTDPWV